MYNLDLLLQLTRDIPDGLDKKQKRKQIPPKMKPIIRERDNNTCKICGLVNSNKITTTFHLHHILPTGEAEPSNLLLLCQHCHNTVHLMLYRMGKWRYTRV